MPNINFPTDGSIGVADYNEGAEWDVQITTARAGRITTRTLPGQRWLAKLTIAAGDKNGKAGRGRTEALLMQLRGGANALALYNPRKPTPLGTLRGAPTVKTAIAAGANAVTINNATTGQTVAAGDLFGLGGQRVMAVADSVVVAGEVTIQFEPPARSAVGAGTSLVWNMPTSLFIPTTPRLWFPYPAQVWAGPIELDLVEL